MLCSPIPAWLKARLTHDNWIVSLGRNTLPVFWLSTLLAVTFHIVREDVFLLPNDPVLTLHSLLVDSLLVGTGMALLFGLAFLLDGTRPGAGKSAAATPSAAKPRDHAAPAAEPRAGRFEAAE